MNRYDGQVCFTMRLDPPIFIFKIEYQLSQSRLANDTLEIYWVKVAVLYVSKLSVRSRDRHMSANRVE